MMDKKEKLQAIVNKGNEARRELHDIEEKEATEKNVHLVGKCFKFSNSYGSGEKWWLYSRIVGVGGSYFKYFVFQECSDGKVIVETRKYGYDSLQQVEITRKEFDKQFRLLLDKLKASIKDADFCLHLNRK